MSVCVKAVTLLIIYLVVVVSEECEDYGDVCVDHEQCCGGCCFYGECIDTYRSCLSSMDVCEDHVCLGEEECIVYMPPECPGCEPLPHSAEYLEHTYNTREDVRYRVSYNL